MDNPDASSRGDAVRLVSVRKLYGGASNGVVALSGVTIGFQRGSFTAAMGPSGPGKTTMLLTAAGLVRPTSGSVVVDGRELTGMSETALAKLRRERIGFVFQAFNRDPAAYLARAAVRSSRSRRTRINAVHGSNGSCGGTRSAAAACLTELPAGSLSPLWVRDQVLAMGRCTADLGSRRLRAWRSDTGPHAGRGDEDEEGRIGWMRELRAKAP